MIDIKLTILNTDLVQSLLEVPFNLERFDLSASIHIKNANNITLSFIKKELFCYFAVKRTLCTLCRVNIPAV